MRVTNAMIMRNSKSDINATKLLVDSTTNQMNTQKKISRPSEDPVVAIRSLRYQVSLGKLDQYLNKNIEDAESWLSITETSLSNMYKSFKEMHSLADQGANGTYNEDDLNTILTSLKSLQKSIYSEGNADYAGRTVFTGYRTNQTLTFQEAETSTKYEIEEPLDYLRVDEKRYYTGDVVVPTTTAEASNLSAISDTKLSTYNRVRLSYDNVENMSEFSYSFVDKANPKMTTYVKFAGADDGSGNYTYTASANSVTINPDGTTTNATLTTPYTMKVYDNEDAWEAASKAAGNEKKTVDDNEIVFIKSTGDIIFGDNVADEISTTHASISTKYEREGFSEGELRPEFYFNCKDISDPANVIEFDKYDKDGKLINYDINYIVANNQTLTVNTEASNVFDMSAYRDMQEMVDAVNDTLAAQKKIDQIKSMMGEVQYADYQDELNQWLDAANKEFDYALDNMHKLFSTEISRSQKYINDVDLAITKVGNKGESLDLTKTRVTSQHETIDELKSENENMNLSDIILDYSAAYVAYQAALTAASKIGEQSLLNYI